MSVVELTREGPSLVEGYRAVVGDGPIRMLEALARTLRGHRLVMVNTTATGGGVSEILHRMVRLLDELGVSTTWELMPGDAHFYSITKVIHNALHGAPGGPTGEELDYFHEMNLRAARELALDGDRIMIHDPQPLPLVEHRRAANQRWVWRCHIDLSHANPHVWGILEPTVARYDAAVFSDRSFVPLLPIPSYLVPPSIDPLSEKNRELDDTTIEAELLPLGLPASVPWITQVSRFDRLKDPIGVIDAFRLVRARTKAHLILAGGLADDDPESDEVLADVRASVKDARDISVLVLPPDAHRTINALQRRSAVVVQKSLREGFALTVSEALWKRRPVVASAVGGIPLQVIHGRTGLLCRSVEDCAECVLRLLRSAELSRHLGAEGREHVRDNFLHTREARDYLAVFATLTNAVWSVSTS